MPKSIAIRLLLVTLLGMPFGGAQAEDRLPIAAKVNNQPVEFAFDTGSEASFLFRSAAERLGLKITKVVDKEPPPPGRVHFDLAEGCQVDFGDGPHKADIAVIDDLPTRAPFDGAISWTTLSNRVFQLDLERGIYKFPAELPAEAKDWTRWQMVPDTDIVMFESSSGKESVRIGLDTACPDGVLLNPWRWQKWRAERVGKPAMLSAGYVLADGLLVNEVFRAKQITIGGITLEDVPVTAASPSADIAFKHCDAILGLYAFRRMAVIVDGKNKAVYTHPITRALDEYAYNHLGAVFIPKDSAKSDDLIARVLKDSPADRAGIRDGDVLLKIGLLNVTKWRNDPTITLNRYWAQADGTKLKLTLKRGDKQYETTVKLEELPAVD